MGIESSSANQAENSEKAIKPVKLTKGEYSALFSGNNVFAKRYLSRAESSDGLCAIDVDGERKVISVNFDVPDGKSIVDIEVEPESISNETYKEWLLGKDLPEKKQNPVSNEAEPGKITESSEVISSLRTNLDILASTLKERDSKDFNQLIDAAFLNELLAITQNDTFLVSDMEQDLSKLETILDAFGRAKPANQLVDSTDSLRSLRHAFQEIGTDIDSLLSKAQGPMAERKDRLLRITQSRVDFLDEKAALLDKYLGG